MKIGLVLEGGGIYGAYTDGIIEALLPHTEIDYIIGTSAGAKTGLSILWAQARALEQAGRTEGESYRRATHFNFEKASSKIWKHACVASTFAHNADNILSPWFGSQADKLKLWRNGQDRIANYHIGNSAHPLVNLFKYSLQGIERDLCNPHLARLTTNCVHLEDGAEVLTHTRDAAGKVMPANLDMHAASGVIPPIMAAIDGIYIDGAFRRNGPIKGVVPDNGIPLIRVALGKPDFVSRYAGDDLLRQRAREAFDAVTEDLPIDRPTHEFKYPHVDSDRALTQYPNWAVIDDMRAMGRRDTQTAIAEGLLHKLQRPAQKPSEPLRLVA